MDENDVVLRVLSMSLGVSHICALLLDSTLRCWGANLYGQLGLGDAITRTLPPGTSILDAENQPLFVQQLSSGRYFSCGLVSNYSLRCWGLNQVGQLGLGTEGLAESLGDDEEIHTQNPVPLTPP